VILRFIHKKKKNFLSSFVLISAGFHAGSRADLQDMTVRYSNVSLEYRQL